MKGRRDFLRASLLLLGLGAVGKTPGAEAATPFPHYTRDYLGRWAGKEALRLPRVTVSGMELKMVTPHPMTREHFIVKHTLLYPGIGLGGLDGGDPPAEPYNDCKKPENTPFASSK